jgi:hypothetical protein
MGLRKLCPNGLLVLGLACAMLGMSVPLLAAEVEAKKDGVEVYQDATNKSAVVTTLKSGQAVVAGERKGMYWQVTVAGKPGFVSVLAVKHRADADAGLAKAIKSVASEGRSDSDGKDSRARSAVMGVRGLADDDNVGNAANIRPNLRAVYQMEDIHANDKKVKALGDQVLREVSRKVSAD